MGWHEGRAPGYPSTNNCLEATNNVIKMEWTLRNRLSIRDFLDIAFKCVQDWSTERDQNCINFKPFAIEVMCSLQIQTEAYQWVKTDAQVITRPVNGSCHFIQPHGKAKLKVADIIKYHRQRQSHSWRTFDTYAASQTKLWFVEFPDTDWTHAKCSCETYLKKFLCRHVIGIAMRLKFFNVCQAAKNIPIGQKRKRGRPALAKRALLTQ